MSRDGMVGIQPIQEVRSPALSTIQFVPDRYEPNYPYPLLVWFHGRGSDEESTLRYMSRLSRRNYVAIGLRGPEMVLTRGRGLGFGWGAEFSSLTWPCTRARGRTDSIMSQFRQSLGCEDSPSHLCQIEDSVFSEVRETRRMLHVHSERIYLIGVGEGAAVAFRLGLSHPDRFAGVISINGWVPGGFPQLARWKTIRHHDFRILALHGAWNERVPAARTRETVSSYREVGIPVSSQEYPSRHGVSRRMLSDIDEWLIRQCSSNRARDRA